MKKSKSEQTRSCYCKGPDSWHSYLQYHIRNSIIILFILVYALFSQHLVDFMIYMWKKQNKIYEEMVNSCSVYLTGSQTYI